MSTGILLYFRHSFAISTDMRNSTYPPHFAEKYFNIPYVILDIPKIVPDDHFGEVWKEKNVPIVRTKPDPRYPYSPEEAEEVYQRTRRVNEYTMPNWNGMVGWRSVGADGRWAESLINGPMVLPKLFQQLNDLLPIVKLTYVIFWSNQREIGVHRDLKEQYPLPTSIRVVIEDNNTRPTFYLDPVPADLDANFHSKEKPDDWSKCKFVDVSQTESNTFLYNNQQWAHGAQKIDNHSKILCSISCQLDWVKYEKLMDQSIAKYGNNLP